MTSADYGFDLMGPAAGSGHREHHISFRDSQLTANFQCQRRLLRI